MIQGQAKNVKRFFYLNDREGVDATFLTYDEKIDGAIYFPDSTWAEGRNLLLESAIESGNAYQYYLFVDDDTSFIKGGFELFEEQLLEYNPAIAMPVFAQKSYSAVLGIGEPYDSEAFVPLRPFQICKKGDAQYMAFHRDVISDRLVVPLQTKFDRINWWCTSSTQQLLIFNIYPESTLQFNNVVTSNDAHRAYAKDEFKQIQNEWLDRQFIGPFNNPRPYAINLLSPKEIRRCRDTQKALYPKYINEFTHTLLSTLTYTKVSSHLIPEEKLLRLLRSDSELLAQHKSAKPLDKPGR